MLIRAEEAIQKANRVLRQCGTRNADRIARELGLIVMPRDFSRQKGAYMVIERNRYIFINKHLDPVMHDIVLLHEIGHDCLHRGEAIQVGGLQEFNIFDMRNQRMEYEANMFAAQIALPDDEILEYMLHRYLGKIFEDTPRRGSMNVIKENDARNLLRVFIVKVSQNSA